MSNMISVEKSKPSTVRRFSLLPRVGLVIDFAGKQLTYRHVPTLETLLNLRKRGFSMKNFVDIVFEQLSEISLKEQPKVAVNTRTKKRKLKK